MLYFGIRKFIQKNNNPVSTHAYEVHWLRQARKNNELRFLTYFPVFIVIIRAGFL